MIIIINKNEFKSNKAIKEDTYIFSVGCLVNLFNIK